MFYTISSFSYAAQSSERQTKLRRKYSIEKTNLICEQFIISSFFFHAHEACDGETKGKFL